MVSATLSHKKKGTETKRQINPRWLCGFVTPLVEGLLRFASKEHGEVCKMEVILFHFCYQISKNLNHGLGKQKFSFD